MAAAQATETAGFNGFFRSDHFLKMGDVDGLPGPTHAWITLGGLARETNKIRLGTLVSPVTFYHPGPLAIAVAQVDAMSGGRIDFGLGAGWFEAEHSAYGLEFPALGSRFDRLEEALEQIHGLWTTPEGAAFSHSGRFTTFSESPALPKPAQRPHPPIIIGGRGVSRTPRLAARYAADFNLAFAPLAEVAPALARVDAVCGDVGRDPAEIVRSATLILCLGANDAEIDRRAAAIGRQPDELRQNGLAGTPDEILSKMSTYAKAGIQRLYLQVLDLQDLDHIHMGGADLVGQAADL